MRILILTTQVDGRGGIQYVGRLLLRSLRDALGPQAEIHVVSMHDEDQTASPSQTWTVHGGRGSTWRTSRLAIRLLRRGPWDVLILGHLHLAPLLLTARRGRDWKVGLGFVYGLEAWRPLSRFRQRGVERLDQLLYISEHTRAAACEINPWLQMLSNAVCHLGLLPEVGGRRSEGGGQRAEVRGRRSEGGAEEFALSIGRMASDEAYKGFEEMIRVWPLVEQRRPGLRLVIIGDGDDRPRLQQIAVNLGANVSFLGAVDDSTRDTYLHACRCFCLPSRGEGFGLVYLEAMRAGKPVLAGNQDAGREVVADGVTGSTVDARNPQELLEGIVDVSGGNAPTMGESGRQRFEQLFSYDVFVQRLTEHLGGAAPSVRPTPSGPANIPPGSNAPREHT